MKYTRRTIFQLRFSFLFPSPSLFVFPRLFFFFFLIHFPATSAICSPIHPISCNCGKCQARLTARDVADTNVLTPRSNCENSRTDSTLDTDTRNYFVQRDTPRVNYDSSRTPMLRLFAYTLLFLLISNGDFIDRLLKVISSLFIVETTRFRIAFIVLIADAFASRTTRCVL